MEVGVVIGGPVPVTLSSDRRAEIAAVRATAETADRRLCLRELRFWRRFAFAPLRKRADLGDPLTNAAIAAYRDRMDHLHHLDLASALTRLQARQD